MVGVSDGDTITVLHDGKGERIRLHGIDCPEKRQAFGKRAKQPIMCRRLKGSRAIKIDQWTGKQRSGANSYAHLR